MSRPSVLWLAAAGALAGCSTPDRNITPALLGTWGGQHIALTVGEIDSDVQFDCAVGSIFGPYFVRTDGSFEWPGNFTRGTGGPALQGQEQPAVAATYVGVLTGPAMTLSVKLDDGTTIGPFTLARFQDAQLTRCL
jgi:hypothetical protein